MKPLNAGRLALVYAGCFLGAGYLSGQELWQFFGAFGIGGVWGLVLCAALQTVFCVILFSLVRRSRQEKIEHVVIRRERRRLRAAVGVTQLISLFGVTVIMSAGAGALAEQMLGRGAVWVSLIFCAAVAVLSLRGMRGLIAVLSWIVPALVVAAFGVAVWAVAHFGWDAFQLSPPVQGTGSPLLVHWSVAAVLFVSYNLFGSIAVLIPLAPAVPNAAVARRGAALGTLLLFAAACAILFSLSLCPDAVTQELPMLALAQTLHPMLGRVFAILLLFAMFGTALTCTVAAQGYLAQKLPVCDRHPWAVILPFSALSFAGGLFGFGDLIGWIYPMFGYLGFAVLCSVAAHERYWRRMERAGKS